VIEFPILDEPDQMFGAVLNRRRVSLRLRYNGVSDRWSFDLSIDNLPVLSGRRIVTGVDLLQPYRFDIGVMFAAPVTDGAEPNRTDLPAGLVRLYSATDEEVEAATA